MTTGGQLDRQYQLITGIQNHIQTEPYRIINQETMAQQKFRRHTMIQVHTVRYVKKGES